ncbi:MAG: hypothetical protein FWC26_00320, partial [Fibromonadales bacterium]|nr:hypothetical protein [Fibromonadales bacterium]
MANFCENRFGELAAQACALSYRCENKLRVENGELRVIQSLYAKVSALASSFASLSVLSSTLSTKNKYCTNVQYIFA